MSKYYYIASITEQSYRDNYESGEIEGTLVSISLNDDEKFDTPQEVLKYFYEYYYGNYGGVYVIDNDDSVKYGTSIIACAKTYGFEPASEEQLKAWKEDKIDLYKVEYTLQIKKVEMVGRINLRNLGFEVKQG